LNLIGAFKHPIDWQSRSKLSVAWLSFVELLMAWRRREIELTRHVFVLGAIFPRTDKGR